MKLVRSWLTVFVTLGAKRADSACSFLFPQLKKPSLLIFSLLLLLPACQTYFSQRAEEIYADGVLPEIAEALANPKLSRDQEARAMAKDRRGMIPVAVVGNGTDYLHPSLFDQIDFTIENGRVVGAGTDIMANDSYAHPTIVGHGLFAFGAQGIDEKGRIIGKTENPIALFDQMNRQFMEALLQNISQTPELEGTLFAKLNSVNFSLLGAFNILLSQESHPFKQDDYDEGVNKENILKPADDWKKHLEKMEKDPTIHKELHRVKMFEYLADWNSMDDEGMPRVNFLEFFSPISSVNSTYGAPSFLKVLKQTFETFDAETNFSGNMNVYSQFLKAQGVIEEGTAKDDRLRESISKLQQSWYRVYSDFVQADPYRKVLNEIGIALSDDSWLAILEGRATFEDFKVEIEGAIEKKYDHLKAIYQVVVDHPLAVRQNRIDARENLEKIEVVKNQVLEYLRTRGFEDFKNMLDPDFNMKPLPGREAYSQMGALVHNPFLAEEDYRTGYGLKKVKKLQRRLNESGEVEYAVVWVEAKADDYRTGYGLKKVKKLQRRLNESGEVEYAVVWVEAKADDYLDDSRGGYLQSSNTESHETHTGATIVAHNENILLHPIRVLTSSKLGSFTHKMAVANRFQGHFNRWIDNPAVFQAIVDLLKPFLTSIEEGGVDTKQMDPRTRRRVKAEIIEIVKEELIEQAEASSLNMEFFEQILQSIAVIGEKKIPFANISLGSDFKQPPAIPNQEDREQLLNNAFEFLQFEMFKFLIAEELQKKAPGTTLFIAAGNDGAWLDAESRSALPAVISSPWLRDYRSLGTVPNNNVDNILVVGSLQQDGENLSSFTNVIIRNGIPYVLSIGEGVVSAIQLQDPSGDGLEFEKQNVDSLNPLVVADEIPIVELLNAMGDNSLEGLSPQEISAAESSLRFEILRLTLNFPSNMREVLKREFCAIGVNCSMPMNGTSMATPNALGAMVDAYINWLAAKGLVWSDDLYNKEGFRPVDFINWVLDQATPLDATLRLDAGRILNIKDLRFTPEKTPMLHSKSPVCREVLLGREAL